MSKLYGSLGEEYEHSLQIGKLTDKTIELISKYSEKILQKHVNEWNATDEQKSQMHENGMNHVKKHWNNSKINTNYTKAAYILNVYNFGVISYIHLHKKLA